jgi:hypothetical protein
LQKGGSDRFAGQRLSPSSYAIPPNTNTYCPSTYTATSTVSFVRMSCTVIRESGALDNVSDNGIFIVYEN